jgi:hypothetical protein
MKNNSFKMDEILETRSDLYEFKAENSLNVFKNDDYYKKKTELT